MYSVLSSKIGYVCLRLEFRGTLGSGSYADVYHCVLTSGDLRRHVAVKKMKPELLQSDTDVNDFFRETELLLRASEPGSDYILKFFGVCYPEALFRKKLTAQSR